MINPLECSVPDFKHHNNFTYWTDAEGGTVIGDYDCNRITNFLTGLTDHEVQIWCDGYENGRLRVVREGRLQKLTR